MNSRDLVDILADMRPDGSVDPSVLRDDFEEKSGKAFAQDSFYQERIYLFLEWYLCDSSPEHPPLMDIIACMDSSDTLRLEAEGLLHSHRSLFELMEPVRRGKMWLRDVIGGGEWIVEATTALPGFQVGDQVDARIRYHNGWLVFGAGFVFHPPAARDAVHALIDRWRREDMERMDMLSLLARLHILAYRFSHIPVERIYSEEGLKLLEHHQKDEKVL